MFLVDTHAHLTMGKFHGDLDAVIQRTGAAGVGAIITLATSLDDCPAVLRLAERFPSVFAAVGVHPNEIATAPPDVAAPLAEFARHPKVVAIGETGMDYHYLPSRWPQQATALSDADCIARQRQTFQQQLDLAARLDKPVVIHERECAADLLAMLEPYRGRLRGVFHCFGGAPDIAQRILDLGFHISFTGLLTFKRNTAVRDLAAALPPERVMLETDCPYMAPEPHRGKRCEPAMVVETARALAEARRVSLDEVARQTTENARRLFGLP